MANQPLKGFARLVAAWRNSLAGFRDIWRNEEAFRMEVVIWLITLPLAFVIADGFRTSVLIGVGLLVLAIEVLNSAIEAVVDRIGPERHELSRMAKDLGSLAVLLAMFIFGVLWLGALWEWWMG